MIFKIYNKISPPGYKRVSQKTFYPVFSGTKYSPGSLRHSETRPKMLTSFRFLREVRPKQYADYRKNGDSSPCHRIFALSCRHKTLTDSSCYPSSDFINTSRPRSLEAVELLRKVRPKLYGLPCRKSSDSLSVLPQPNMGAGPINNSATVQHGCCYSNHGGK